MRAVVVGGGFAGLAIADALASNSWMVDCLDLESTPGAGCSQASLGLVFPASPRNWPAELVELTLRSFDLLLPFVSGLADRSGVHTMRTTRGLLEVAAVDREVESLRQELDAYAALGVSGEWLDERTVANMEPFLKEQAGGIAFNGARYLDAPATIRALDTSLVRQGGRSSYGVAASQLVTSRGRCLGVKLRDGTTIWADFVILATGGTSAGLYPELDRVVTTSRGQWIHVRPREAILTRAVYLSELDLIPCDDGTIMIGATQEGPGQRVPTLDGVAELARQFRQHYSAPSELEVLNIFVGLRALVGDGMPLIGPSARLDNLLVCNALYKNGATLLPLLGSLFAESLISGDWATVAAPFSPARISADI